MHISVRALTVKLLVCSTLSMAFLVKFDVCYIRISYNSWTFLNNLYQPSRSQSYCINRSTFYLWRCSLLCPSSLQRVLHSCFSARIVLHLRECVTDRVPEPDPSSVRFATWRGGPSSSDSRSTQSGGTQGLQNEYRKDINSLVDGWVPVAVNVYVSTSLVSTVDSQAYIIKCLWMHAS